MAKIDLHEWREFVVGELFYDDKFVKPHVLHNRQVRDDDYGIPYVVRTKFNNGISRRVSEVKDIEPSPAGVISWGAENATFFYQEEPFLSGRDIYYLDTRDIEPMACRFLTACLQKVASKYPYNYGLFPELMKTERIKLPAEESGEPDWAYMESYMVQVMQEAEQSLDAFEAADDRAKPVDVMTWKEFVIGDLFDVVKGTRLTKANMKQGETRFIGSSAMNNGITAHISNNERVHPANTLTVCYNGSIGETFYQDEPFWASDDVNVLYPKFDMTRDIALFIAPILKRVSERYMYTDKWKKETMETDSIKLPVDASGEPNWAYMDSFMSQVMTESEAIIDELSSAGVSHV